MLRVAPRDLFNDGNLLTNYGHLYIALENIGLENRMQHYNEEEQFQITSNMDGDTFLTNVKIYDAYDCEIQIFRPINSRDKYSLCFIDNEDGIEEVFAELENGGCELSESFKEMLIGEIDEESVAC